MSRALMTIGEVSIGVDEHGRLCLNDLWDASGKGTKKTPSRWTRLETTKQLVHELPGLNPDLGLVIQYEGETYPKTYAHELLAVSYAGWISPSFQLRVNQAFLDSRRHDVTMPVLRDPKLQMLMQAIVRLDEVELIAREAEVRAVRAETKIDILVDEQRMTLEAFVLKNGLLRQCPENTWVAGGKWCSEWCGLYNIAARSVTVYGKAWKTAQAYPPEALMAWVHQMAREGGQGDLGRPMRKVK